MDERQPELELGAEAIAAMDLDAVGELWRSIQTTLECPICLGRFIDPVAISICSHMFCDVCIRRHALEAGSR